MATIFENNHDSGSPLSNHWPNINDTGSALSVTSAAGLNSSANGIQNDITKAAWSVWESGLTPPGSNGIRSRWRFDVSNLVFPGTTPSAGQYIYSTDMGGGGDVLIDVHLTWDSSDNLQLFAQKRWTSDGDVGFVTLLSATTIPGGATGEHCLEFRIVKESSDGAADGEVQVYVDKARYVNVTNGQNFNSFANYVQYVHRGNNGTGSFTGDGYTDEFILDDDKDAALGCLANFAGYNLVQSSGGQL